MPDPVSPLEPLRSHQIQFRVEYHETDGQRRVHHANYLNYFERGRVAMLRAGGVNYKDIEDEGLMLVVTEMNVRYQQLAEFDDLLTLTTEVVEVRKVRMSHRYTVRRGDDRIVEGDSVIACLDRRGRPHRMPPALRVTAS